MVKIAISKYYYLAKAIQVIISSNSTEYGFEDIRKSIFDTLPNVSDKVMGSHFLRMNSKNFSHIHAFVRSTLNAGMYQPLQKCVSYHKSFKFIFFESFQNGRDRARSFMRYSDLVHAYSNASKYGFMMINEVPGVHHYEILMVVEPSAAISDPNPKTMEHY